MKILAIMLLVYCTPVYSFDIFATIWIDLIRIKMHYEHKEEKNYTVMHLEDYHDKLLIEKSTKFFGDRVHDLGIIITDETTYVCPISIDNNMYREYCVEDIEIYRETL